MTAPRRPGPTGALLLALALGACAYTPGDLPQVHYATAASHGQTGAFFAGRPSEQQVDTAVAKWSVAIADAYACDLPKTEVLQAGAVAALELATMSSLAKGGGERMRQEAVGDYLADTLQLAWSDRPKPPANRCAALSRWLPQVQQEGRAALQRAHEQGLIKF
ncbi:hypothetical protein [Caulobacter sp. 17J80-11]|uniref:hypothetical protein n=1 Tax=Caulobacter sp. 17J80-11 TaxID=2763502 RepID=UPI001653571E|nr:hypothetical protein [Caulobacter sp. 17J80-11]MBC6981042.1 hypothetical protein [Caulobacter sp. 17J80-11]